MRRAPTIALCVATALAGGAAVALAAGLGVSAARLSSAAGATSVPTTTCTLSAGADAWTDQASPDANNGSGTSLRVRSDSTLLLLGANRRTLVRFDLASCAIPSGALVQSARLRLRLTTAPAASRLYGMHRVTSSWSESGVTWNTRPTAATTATSTISTGTASGVFLEWSVLADARAFVAGSATNLGWQLRDAEEGATSTQEAVFASRENATTADRPQLVVTYWP